MTEFDTLARLVAPLSLDEFLGDYYDRRPVHLPGDAARARDLLTRESLERLLRHGGQHGPELLDGPNFDQALAAVRAELIARSNANGDSPA